MRDQATIDVGCSSSTPSYPTVKNACCKVCLDSVVARASGPKSTSDLWMRFSFKAFSSRRLFFKRKERTTSHLDFVIIYSSNEPVKFVKKVTLFRRFFSFKTLHAEESFFDSFFILKNLSFLGLFFVAVKGVWYNIWNTE